MNNNDLTLICETFQASCGWKCTHEVAQELLQCCAEDVALVIKTIEKIAGKEIRSPIPYLKKVLGSEAASAKDRTKRKKAFEGNIRDQFERKYGPARDEGVIDDNEYNFLLHHYDDESKTDSYLRLQYRVQLWWSKQLRQANPEVTAIAGILPQYWQNYAFGMLAVEHQQELDLNLINSEAQRYEVAWNESETFQKLNRGDVRPMLLGMGE